MSIFDKCFGFKKRRAAFTQEANKDRKFVIERQSKDINLGGASSDIRVDTPTKPLDENVDQPSPVSEEVEAISAQWRKQFQKKTAKERKETIEQAKELSKESAAAGEIGGSRVVGSYK